jgi:hypothetical protein
MAAMMAEGATLEQDIHAILADDAHAVVLVNIKGSFKGRTMDTQQILTLHFSQGQISEGWVSFHDPYVVDDFWG